MEFLQAPISRDDIFFGCEAYGFVEQQLFAVEIFLEIVVAQLFIDFEIIAVALAGILETLPHGCFFGRSYFADGVELVLKLAVAREGAVHVVGVFSEGDNFLDDFVFTFEIFGLDGFLFGCVGRFAFAGSGE